MEITTHIDGEEMRVVLQGRLDAAWSEAVGKTLQDSLHSGCHVIALDMSQVSFLSSAGIRVLMLLFKQLQGVGGRLRVLDPSPPVRNVLEMVGFSQLVEVSAAAPAPAAPPPTQAAQEPVSRHIGEHPLDVYALSTGTGLRGRLWGDPSAVLAGTADAAPSQTVRLPAASVCLGLGALGSDDGDPGHAGELLAVGGLAIVLPSNDPAHPDWLVQEGDLVPEASLIYGLEAAGEFRYLLRFGSAPDSAPIRLSELAQAALEICQSEVAVFVAAAETAALVGAARQTPPDLAPGGLFAFPDIRDRLLFTAEPAYGDETALLVGIAARNPAPPLAEFLRPMNGGALFGHVHCAVVPYRPIHKGRIELSATLESLMENQRIRGVLHLLNDHRESVGAGESELRRGALWCAPLVLTEAAS
ncbi:STAS domain-containing protein [Methylogaea oryzae]|uniref:STAS domain-containing protein n=3 Tax=Methylogaea oryzae TaxID=1295382 RepID=A0A8D4VNF5_9GAMM|nr:STAS domain-containing protein [Methylogaea oryzae]BBL70434.1 hypothetical protein MoryE10_10400 [Methylogaea oryzae]